MTVLVAAPRGAFRAGPPDYWRSRSRPCLSARAGAANRYLRPYRAGSGMTPRRRSTVPAGCGAAAPSRRRADGGQRPCWRTSTSACAPSGGWVRLHLRPCLGGRRVTETAEVLISQRRRWATGSLGQCFRGLPWSLVRHLRADGHHVAALLSLQHVGLTIAVPLALAASFPSYIATLGASPWLSAGRCGGRARSSALGSIGAALASRVISKDIRLQFFINLIAMWLMQGWLLPSAVQGSAARSRAAPSPAFHAYTEEGMGTRSRGDPGLGAATCRWS